MTSVGMDLSRNPCGLGISAMVLTLILSPVGGLVCRVCEYIQPQSGNPTLDSWVQDLYPQSDPSCDNPDDTNIRTAECRLCKYLVINVTFILHDYADEAVPAYHVSRSCTLEYLPETMTSCRSDLRRDEELENFKLTSREADYHTANWTGSVCHCDNEDLCNTPSTELPEKDVLIECHRCQWVTTDVSGKSISAAEAMSHLGPTHPGCSDNPDEAPSTLCHSSMCVTAALQYSFTVNGHQMSYQHILRDCALSYDVTSGCHDDIRPILHLFALKGLDFPDATGTICHCDNNDCNDQPEALMKPSPVCYECAVGESEDNEASIRLHRALKRQIPHLVNKHCDGALYRVARRRCGISQICASAVLNITQLAERKHLEGILYVRGCVTVPDWPWDEKICHVTHQKEAAVHELVHTKEVKFISGSICFCSQDVCNDHPTTRLVTVAEERGILCLSCSWVSTTLNNREMLVDSLLDVTRRCYQQPDSAHYRQCDKDQICATLRMKIKKDKNSVILWRRGCVDDPGDVDLDECHFATSNTTKAMSQLLMGNNYTDPRARICLCNSQLCNVHTKQQILPPRCMSCTWVNSEIPEKKAALRHIIQSKTSCRNNPMISDITDCENGDVCATGVIDVDRYGAVDRASATMVLRGCMPGNIIGDLDMMCYNMTSQPALVHHLMGGESVDVHRGSVCLCTGSGCNDQTAVHIVNNTLLDSPGASCLYTCLGQPPGSYQFCHNCQMYLHCKDSAGTLKTCHGDLYWDDYQKACVAESNTCNRG